MEWPLSVGEPLENKAGTKSALLYPVIFTSGSGENP
jgi:hypothetical protein